MMSQSKSRRVPSIYSVIMYPHQTPVNSSPSSLTTSMTQFQNRSTLSSPLTQEEACRTKCTMMSQAKSSSAPVEPNQQSSPRAFDQARNGTDHPLRRKQIVVRELHQNKVKSNLLPWIAGLVSSNSSECQVTQVNIRMTDLIRLQARTRSKERDSISLLPRAAILMARQ